MDFCIDCKNYNNRSERCHSGDAIGAKLIGLLKDELGSYSVERCVLDKALSARLVRKTIGLERNCPYYEEKFSVRLWKRLFGPCKND